MCSFYEVPARFYADQDTLGHAIGKEFRVSVTVTDAGFADEIEKQLKQIAKKYGSDRKN